MRNTIFIELDLNGEKACYRNDIRQVLPSEILSPMRTGDDVLMCVANQELRHGSVLHLSLAEDREKVVEKVAREIAEALVNHLSKQDTFNGYPGHLA